jgi:hypothetical protein
MTVQSFERNLKRIASAFPAAAAGLESEYDNKNSLR